MPAITVADRRLTARHRWPGVSWLLLTILLLGLGCGTPTTPSLSSAAPAISPPPSPPTSPAPPPPPPPPPPSVGSLNIVYLPAPADPPASATDPLVGRYVLDIEAQARSGPRCELLPEYATRRTFTADIHPVADRYAVRLYDAAFLADTPRIGYGCLGLAAPKEGFEACHQFLLAGDASSLSMTIQAEDEWRENEIWRGPAGRIRAGDHRPARPVRCVTGESRRVEPARSGTATACRRRRAMPVSRTISGSRSRRADRALFEHSGSEATPGRYCPFETGDSSSSVEVTSGGAVEIAEIRRQSTSMPSPFAADTGIAG